MKVSKYFKFILGLLIGCVGICTASLTAAWFTYTAQIKGVENEIVGSSEGAYYAWGRGTEEEPFIINKPRHLYNLAWLQYLGRYNKVDEETGKVNQTYFALDPRKNKDDSTDYSGWYLNMDGETIPPIGTEKYPFLGSFDGKGYTIKNLNTSNKYGTDDGDVKKKPAMVTLSNNQLEDVNIVGMFGVIGDIDSKYENKFNSQVLNVKDFDLENATINNKLDNSLVGVLAGYVNGEIKDIGIVDSNLELKSGTNSYEEFENVSDYSTVGYCTEKYLQQVDEGIATIYNSTRTEAPAFSIQEQGHEAKWGGSVDMKNIYDSIKAKHWSKFVSKDRWGYMTTTASNIQYNSSEIHYYNEDGSEDVTKFSNTKANLPSDFSGVRFYESSVKKDNEIVANYCLGVEPENQDGYSSEERFMCLSGYAIRNVANRTTSVTNHGYTNNQCYLIYRNDNGNYRYLSADGTNGITSKSASEATPWLLKNNEVYTYIDEAKYNLSIVNNSLTISNSVKTQWIYSIGNSSSFLSGDYFITYNNGWTLDLLKTYTQITNGNTNNAVWTIKSGSYYLKGTDSSMGTTTSFNEATKFSIQSNRVTYEYDGGTYCIVWTSSGITAGPTDSPYIYNKNGNYLSYYYNYTTYYLRLNNGSLSESRYNATSFTFTPYSYTTKTASSIPLTTTTKRLQYSETTSVAATVEMPDTYFPLASEFDANDLRTDIPEVNNTGYIISGAQYTTKLYGDIRISSFSMSDLSESGGAALNKMYTINDSGSNSFYTKTGNNETFNIDFSEFKRVRNDLINNTFSKDSSNVYGMHFMNAEIGHTMTINGKTHKTIIPKAYILGNEYTNYQVPYDCVDFNLKEKGFITFIAGTYFTNDGETNNSFFSLYKVIRNSDHTINDILRVKYIYEPLDETYSYMYAFENKNGTITGYSTPYTFDRSGNKISIIASENGENSTFNPEAITNNGPSSTKYKKYYNATPVFKTKWIEKRNDFTNDAAYYFQIPMNDGEFALGSVTGGIGAYLIYLDIGANGLRVNRAKIVETFEFLKNVFGFPKGVAVLIAAGNTVDDKNSYCIVVKENVGGTINLAMDNNGGQVTRTSTAAEKALLQYKPDDLSVYDNNTLLNNPSPLKTEKTIYRRLTYLDYKVSNGDILKGIWEEKSTDNGKTRTNRTFNKYNGKGVLDNSLDFYDDEGYFMSNEAINNMTIDNSGCTSAIFKFRNFYFDEGVVSIEYKSTAAGQKASNGVYAHINGYDIQVKFTRKDGTTMELTDKITIVQLHDTNTYTITINKPAEGATGSETVTNSTWTITLTIPAVNG